MQLKYVGEDPQTRWVPGWPASDHEEPDADLAAQKLASGLYVESVGKETTKQGKAASAPSERATAAKESD